jgi:putative lipoic acid-binding regulatory protein
MDTNRADHGERRPPNPFNGVKVFAATVSPKREQLGDEVTHWLENRQPNITVVDIVVRQSSDAEFHCLSIVIFYLDARLCH